MVISLALVAAGAVLNAWVTIHNVGIIKTVGVECYWDRQATNKTTMLQWGNISIDETKSFTFYVKNSGTASLILSMNITNWQPINASHALTYSWNMTGQVLQAQEIRPLIVSLSCNATALSIKVSSFSNDVNIIGTEA